MRATEENYYYLWTLVRNGRARRLELKLADIQRTFIYDVELYGNIQSQTRTMVRGKSAEILQISVFPTLVLLLQRTSDTTTTTHIPSYL